jgi:hypothetical protein
MVADVYAGDDDLLQQRVAPPPASAFLYLVETEPDPDAWARVAHQFMLANLLPDSATLTRRDDSTVVMAVELRGVSVDLALAIERKLSQLTCVLRVSQQRVTLRPRAVRQPA